MMAKTKEKRRVTADDLGIDVWNKSGTAVFHWLMCVILMSKPIQQELAGAAFKRLRARKIATPDRICEAGWRAIVDALGEAHYVRYDESTATRLLEASELLRENYDGRITKFISSCDSADELYEAVQRFKGVGATGADIFMREIAPAYFGRQWH